MQELFFGPVTAWFGIPAVVGTMFFTARLLMMLVGGDVDADAGDAEIGADTGDGDSSQTFKVLSIQAIASFLMGFGWGGLGALQGAAWPLVVAIPFAVLVGFGMVWIMARLLRFVYGLQSSGTLPLFHALESEGTVYAGIPAGGEGAGEVRLVIGERERYYRATTDGPELERGMRIRVVAVDEVSSSVKVESV